MRILRPASKYMMSVFYILAGANHFIDPAFYLRIMPSYLPCPSFLVLLSGLFEVLLGGLLLAPRLTGAAAYGLIALLLAVFPANIHMAMHPELYGESSPLVLWLRLPLQLVLIAWAYWHAGSPKASVRE